MKLLKYSIIGITIAVIIFWVAFVSLTFSLENSPSYTLRMD